MSSSMSESLDSGIDLVEIVEDDDATRMLAEEIVELDDFLLLFLIGVKSPCFSKNNVYFPQTTVPLRLSSLVRLGRLSNMNQELKMGKLTKFEK